MILKKRYYGLIFLALALMATGDFALWNDGAHFLYRLLEYEIFIDKLWGRYLDLSFQLIPSALIDLGAPLHLIIYSYKLSAIVLPVLLVIIQILRLSALKEHTAINFLQFILFWALSSLVYFPVSTIYLSVSLSAIFLSFFLQKKEYGSDKIMNVLIGCLLVFGHEIMYPVLFVPLIISIVKKNRKNLITWMTFSILVLVGIAFLRVPTWLDKSRYISENLGPKFQYQVLHLLWLLVVPLLLVSRKKWGVRIGYGFVAFALVFIVSEDWIHIYEYILMYKMLSVIMVLCGFCYISKYGTPAIERVIKVGAFFSIILFLKIFVGWRLFEKKMTSLMTLQGCHVVAESFFYPQYIPGWTYPYLSVLLQETWQPKKVLFQQLEGLDSNCFKAGNTIITSNKMESYLNFYGKIDSTYLSKSIPELSWDPETEFFGNRFQFKSHDYFNIEIPTDKICVKVDARSLGSEGTYFVLRKGLADVEPVLVKDEVIYLELSRGIHQLKILELTSNPLFIHSLEKLDCSEVTRVSTHQSR